MREWSNSELSLLQGLGTQVKYMDADGLEELFPDRNIVEIISQSCTLGIFNRDKLSVSFIRECVDAINEAKSLMGFDRIDFGKSVVDKGYILSMNSGPYGNYLPIIRCASKREIWYNIVSLKYTTCKDLLYNIRATEKLLPIQSSESTSYKDCKQTLNNLRKMLNRLDSLFIE